MKQSCPHCDQPDMSLLHRVLMGEILRADETLLMRLADVMQEARSAESAAARVRPQKGTPQVLRR